MSRKSTAKKALVNTVPVMCGYIVLGIAFGILLVDKGYNAIWALIMSLTIYAGSMQFVTIGLLSGGASLVSTAIMTLMVNARHFLYGISMLEKYRGAGAKKPYLIFSLTDETYALVCNGAPDGTDGKLYYFLVSLFNQCYWIIGCTVGGLIGSAITFNTSGIDFAMTALFIVIFTEQLISSKQLVPASIGVCTSIVCLIIFKANGFLIPSMILITVILCIYSRFEARSDGNE